MCAGLRSVQRMCLFSCAAGWPSFAALMNRLRTHRRRWRRKYGAASWIKDEAVVVVVARSDRRYSMQNSGAHRGVLTSMAQFSASATWQRRRYTHAAGCTGPSAVCGWGAHATWLLKLGVFDFAASCQRGCHTVLAQGAANMAWSNQKSLHDPLCIPAGEHCQPNIRLHRQAHKPPGHGPGRTRR